ncbi:MAG: hypothetical protein UW88_C0003G0036 [Candidatus Collierbacteria bacterium GW2011_GWD2_45_10]|nr:MAG: hypothetical protein UW31_C0001G0048 [Candidatus Collierbacteria bacterium GW2011_GWA2_44_13]KKT89397.1 MAG: hypothetical protein UW88_C0003G0036 [Candidatus Collierbacteria bacterium GW2011_GWD2_45_10]
MVLFFLSFLAYIFAPPILATAKTDYDYQYGQYRLGYSEFLVLKQDYLNTPSLDNQQKAMLLAKQTIVSRDLAKASLNLYLIDLIGSYKVDYEPIKPVLISLDSARQFFLMEAQKSQGVTTQADLKKLSQKYQDSVPEKDSVSKFGIVANKIAALVRIQMDSKAAFDELIPKLPNPMPTGLSARVQELTSSAKIIDDKIYLLASNLNLAEAVAESTTAIFFDSRIEKLVEIRTLQLDWINRLIDIDINYVQLQN